MLVFQLVGFYCFVFYEVAKIDIERIEKYSVVNWPIFAQFIQNRVSYNLNDVSRETYSNLL